ncbi:hypothetical protein JTE90_009259 [Oedothorax gibbosus]|uniref:Uncharacterized protein n=1 Tax=Oedothorax gibbosus TaxID=931172 RepID=A0AAV6V0Z8_9ARAC|nr:hypothetical protein JTE90_009259 [Oedothorax gibbosus]
MLNWRWAPRHVTRCHRPATSLSNDVAVIVCLPTVCFDVLFVLSHGFCGVCLVKGIFLTSVRKDDPVSPQICEEAKPWLSSFPGEKGAHVRKCAPETRLPPPDTKSLRFLPTDASLASRSAPLSSTAT